MERYLAADRVAIPTTISKFGPEGRCDWCGKELTGRSKRFCPPGEDAYFGYNYSLVSSCSVAFGNWWYSIPAFKRAVLIRDNFTCRACGYHEMQEERPWLPKTSGLHCDHIIPLSKGGETELGNLQTLCERHNRDKAARLPGEPPVRHRLRGREAVIAAGQLELIPS